MAKGKNIKIQTQLEAFHARTQTPVKKLISNESQTDLPSSHKQCMTQPMNVTDSTCMTNNCLRVSRHVQTELIQKTKGTQYKPRRLEQSILQGTDKSETIISSTKTAITPVCIPHPERKPSSLQHQTVQKDSNIASNYEIFSQILEKLTLTFPDESIT